MAGWAKAKCGIEDNLEELVKVEMCRIRGRADQGISH